jgi:hypothetical protein
MYVAIVVVKCICEEYDGAGGTKNMGELFQTAQIKPALYNEGLRCNEIYSVPQPMCTVARAVQAMFR